MGLDTVLNDILNNHDFKRYKNTAFFNFNGGLRDFLIPSSSTPFDKLIERSPSFQDSFFAVSNMQMKNLYQSLDHNSQLYSKDFLN